MLCSAWAAQLDKCTRSWIPSFCYTEKRPRPKGIHASQLQQHQAVKVAWESYPQGTASTDKGSMGEPSSRDLWLLCLPRRRMRTASTTSMKEARNTPPATGINIKDQRGCLSGRVAAVGMSTIGGQVGQAIGFHH